MTLKNDAHSPVAAVGETLPRARGEMIRSPTGETEAAAAIDPSVTTPGAIRFGFSTFNGSMDFSV
jgi:hypothetical protein